VPVQTCPRCRRVNPELAIYCYFDGFELRVPSDGTSFRMPSEFVFPSGRRCATYDQFAQGCQEEWSAARDLLHQGAFGRFFASCGRADLVRAAQDANAQTSGDAALATFLAALPGVRTQTPKLDVNPRRVFLDKVLAGETRKQPITISNTAQGCLQGTASITEGQDMVSLADSRPVHEIEVNAPRQQALTLFLNTRGLPANQGHGAKMTVVTNGGVVEVPLRLELVARPFPTAPFQGVKAQRELAERMKAQPKAAVPVLESGEVRRWFETNGWLYPVAGAEMRGVAAVQQFFEALGLAKPPVVQISQPELRMGCQYPQSARFELTLSTPAKKWVYATVTSDSPWVKIPQPQISGPRQAKFLIEVDSSRMTTVGPHGEAKVKLVCNGGQGLEVRVIADVSGMPAVRPGIAPAVPLSAAPVDGMRAAMPMAQYAPPLYSGGRPSASGRTRSSFLASLLILPILMLLMRLGMVLVSDGFARGESVRCAAHKLEVPIDPNSKVGAMAGWLRLPWSSIMLASEPTVPGELFAAPNKMGSSPVTADFRDYFVSAFVRIVVFLTWWLGGVIGVVVLWRRGGILDVPWGFVAGAVAGLAGGATFACVYLAVEMVPQFAWHLVGDPGGPGGWFGWVLLALIWWLALGVGFGIVCAILPPLRRVVLMPLQRIPSAIFRTAGMTRLADFWWMP